MNYREIKSAIDSHSDAGQFSVKFDVSQLPARLEQVKAEMASAYQLVNEFCLREGITTKFNHNSSASKKPILAKFDINCDDGAAKDKYEHLKGTNAIIDALLQLGELEHERRYIEGNKKGENVFASYVDSEGRFTPEMVWGDTRIYFNRMYSLPKQMRKMVTPLKKSKFLYLDLSSAEAVMAGYQSRDELLLKDCLSGEFWPLWYELLGLDKSKKEDIKVAIYSCMYSLSDYSIPVTVGKRFFNMFFDRYKVLFKFLNDRIRQAKTTGSVPCEFEYSIPIQGEKDDHKFKFRALNLSTQFSLAYVMMGFVTNLCNKGYHIGTFAFDSLIVEVEEEDVKGFLLEFDKEMEVSGYKFCYKTSIGSNYFDAQYGGS